MRVKLLSCPECGDVPEVGYVCGEDFIMSAVHPVGECFCGNFTEMHSSFVREIEAWNKAVEDYKKNEDNTCSDCIHKDDDGGYCLEYNSGDRWSRKEE